MGAFLIVVGCLVCAIQAIRVQRLLISALWLAGASALTALLLYILGAPEIAVIELSVGAGLVTVIFVFAINIAGEEKHSGGHMIPRWLAVGLVAAAVMLLGWLVLPAINGQTVTAPQPQFAAVLWQDRVGDMMLQVLLILAGVLGVIGLLSEGKKEPQEGDNE